MSNSAFKALYLVLEPTTSASVPNGSLFLDSGNGNQLSHKDSSGVSSIVAVSSGGNPFLRQMVAGEAFAANKPLAIRADGKVVLADSDGVNRTNVVCHSMQASLGDGSVINVLCISAVLSGALTGLGFTSGDKIYMGETAGEYTNNVNTFTGNNDSYVKVGIALPPASTASSAATDLLIHTEIIAQG